MATSAYAATVAGEAAAGAASPSRRVLAGGRPPPPCISFLSKSPSWCASISLPPGPRRAAAAAEERVEEEEPTWVELEPIGSEQQLERALAEAQQLGLPIVLLW